MSTALGATPAADTPAVSPLTPVLSDIWDVPRSWTREVYDRHGGYDGLRTALAPWRPTT